MDLLQKRKKFSGLTGVEVEQAFMGITALLEKCKRQAYANGRLTDDVDELSGIAVLKTMQNFLQSKRTNPQSYSPSGLTTDDHLDELHLTQGLPYLTLKSGCGALSAVTDSLGVGHRWSAEGLYHHLCFLEEVVPRKNEAATRLWIEAFLFRVACMLTGEKKVIVNVEHPVSSVANTTSSDSLSRFVGFAITMIDKPEAELSLRRLEPLRRLRSQDHAFFVSEAKEAAEGTLSQHIPQAVHEMFVCAKKIGKNIIRGALTNGLTWIFIFLKLKDEAEGGGGTFFLSDDISFKIKPSFTSGSKVTKEGSSFIAAIIAHWVKHSHAEIGEDDYFEKIPAR